MKNLLLTLLLAFCVAHILFRVIALESNLPAAVLNAIDKNAVLSDMRNAKIDCERILSRTQECVLIYEYVPVNK